MMKFKNKFRQIILSEALWGVFIGGMITFISQYYMINKQNTYSDRITIVKTYPDLKITLEEQYHKYFNVALDLYKTIDLKENHPDLKDNFTQIHNELTLTFDTIILFVLGYTKNDLTKQTEFLEQINSIKDFLKNDHTAESPSPLINGFKNAKEKKEIFLNAVDTHIKNFTKNS